MTLFLSIKHYTINNIFTSNRNRIATATIALLYKGFIFVGSVIDHNVVVLKKNTSFNENDN